MTINVNIEWYCYQYNENIQINEQKITMIFTSICCLISYEQINLMVTVTSFAQIFYKNYFNECLKIQLIISILSGFIVSYCILQYCRLYIYRSACIRLRLLFLLMLFMTRTFSYLCKVVVLLKMFMLLHDI